MRQIGPPYIIRLAAILISLSLLVLALYHLKIVLVPLVFSIIFAVMLFPLCIRLEKWGFSKGLAAFFSVFIGTLVLGFITYILVRQLSLFTDHLPQISAKMNAIIDQLKDYAVHKFNMKKTVAANKVQEQLTLIQNGLVPSLSFSVIGSLLINIFLIPLYIFFLIYYRHFFIEFFYKTFHSADKEVIDDTIVKIGIVIKGYLFGQFLDIVIIGAANAAALYFIGVGYAIILGFIIAVLCIVPYLGMIAGSVIALLVAFITTDTGWQPLTAFGVLWIIHIIDSNIVAPLVIGSKISVNPLVAIFVLFLFGELWGLGGLFLALPLTAILKVIFDAIPGLKSIAFLLGEPEKYHLKKYSYQYIHRLQAIMDLRKQKPISDSLPGETGEPVTPGDGPGNE
jgi:predicted PurR-regulated permease PerM